MSKSKTRTQREQWTDQGKQQRQQSWSKKTDPAPSTKIQLFIESQALQKIKAYAWVAQAYEIGGFGFVRKTDRGNYVVYDVMIPNQEVTPGGIDLVPIEAIEYGRENGYPNTDLKFSWHTHGSGSAGWSGIDEKRINELLYVDGMPWVFSMCLNCDYTSKKLRLDIKEPVRYRLDNVDLVEIMSDEFMEKILEEADQKVITRSYHHEPDVLITRGSGPNIIFRSTRGEVEISKLDPETGDIDLDRDDVSEEEAAHLLADIGEREGEPVDILKSDPEDAAQDELVKELETHGGLIPVEEDEDGI